jgi:hypothetical protein
MRSSRIRRRNLEVLINQLPGITLTQGNRSTLAYFSIRGSTGSESRTEIDGHPLSTGVSGVYYIGLLNPGIFEFADLTKGPDVSAADAGESMFGTLNLRTWDFTDKLNGFVSQGVGSYGAAFTSILLRGSLFANKKLSFVADYNVNGYNGPAFGTKGPLASPNTGGPPATTTAGTGTIGTATVDYSDTFDAGQRLASEVFKLRYRFSDTTSIWAGFVGSQGYVSPEGDLYGYYYGPYTIVPCTNGGVGSPTLAGCNQTSAYSNPALAQYFGQTIPLYSAYPAETQTENNPLFEAEFRTAFKNDTLLIRPFTQVVQRINDGTLAPNVPGNNGAFSLAPSPSACAANNPCYISNGGTLVSYTSANNPCATSNTPIANSCYQDGTPSPFYQYEIDRLHGVTGVYLHPLGDLGSLRLSYEYTSDYTYDLSGNAPTQVTPLQIAGYPPFTTSISDVSNVSVPGAVRRSNDVSLAAFLTPTPKLSVGLGLFYNLDSLAFSSENPAILALAPNAPGGASSLPYQLVNTTINKSHFDPHGGLVYNVNSNVAVRAAAGSSVTLPYAQQVSGLPTFSQPTATYPFGYYSEKNPYLVPETTVGYNVGADVRLPDGGVFSLDGFQNTIHDKILTLFTFPNGRNAPAVSTTSNASLYQSYGLEFGFKNDQRLGLGYTAQLTLLRDFYYNLGPAYYSVNTGYLTLFDNRQPDGQPYATAHVAGIFKGGNGVRAELGLDYQGNNNSYFVGPFVTWYATVRANLVNRLAIQVNARNIFDYQDLAGIAKATPFGTGVNTVSCKYAPSPTNPQQYVQTACQNYTNGQQQIEPQTFGLALQYRL